VAKRLQQTEQLEIFAHRATIIAGHSQMLPQSKESIRLNKHEQSGPTLLASNAKGLGYSITRQAAPKACQYGYKMSKSGRRICKDL
jgi:hypothetical protein